MLSTGSTTWNPHKVEMALWAHFVVGELKKELLDGMPGGLSAPPPAAPTATPQQTTENGESQTEQQPQKEKNVSGCLLFCVDCLL